MAINPLAGVAAHPRRIRDLPGPLPLPLLGNFTQIDKQRMHQTLERWAQQYGEMYRFRIAARQFMVVTNPEVIGTILRDRPDGFQRTERLNEAARELRFNGVFTSNGEHWKRQRPMVLRGLAPAHLKSFFPTLVKVTERFARRWQRAAAIGHAIDLQADLMRYTVDVTAGLAFGTEINTIESANEQAIQRHLDKILPTVFKRAMAPWRYWHWIKLPSDRQIDRHVEALCHSVSGFVAEARRRLDENPELREHPRNLIEAMVAERDREGSQLTDEDVSGNMLTMLLAGEDTTANTLAWMIWLLHRHPEALQRAAAEVRGVLGDATVATSLDQLNQLDYVQACANETMRIKPVAPMQVAQPVHDTVLAGVEVPKSTLIICLMRPSTMDDKHFPDAHTFSPERWLAPDGPSVTAAKRVSMPFGAGPRMCPGRYLALAEIKMVAAMLLATFDIESVCTPQGGDVQEKLAMTMSPIGLRMKLRQR